MLAEYALLVFELLQLAGRRKAPRQALRKAPYLRIVGRLLRALDNLSRAAADAVEAAAAVVHVQRVQGVLSSRRRSARRRC